MINHAKALHWNKMLVVVDMPKGSYNNPNQLKNRQFKTGCDAIKLKTILKI